ncbi:MAG TPA: methyltransferase type 11, partial [Mycobacterium sp.]
MTADPLRNSLRAIWSAAASSWGTHADFLDTRGGVVTRAMIDAASLRFGDQLLELACGPGASVWLRPRSGDLNGNVVLSDTAPKMIALADQRLKARLLGNVTIR